MIFLVHILLTFMSLAYIYMKTIRYSPMPAATKIYRGSKKKRIKKNKNNITTYVYILCSTTNCAKSYIGVTNNLTRRLKQHNGIVQGGARYTSSNRPWEFYAVFKLNNRHDALSLEWKAKHKKRKSDGTGLEGKVVTITRLGKLYTKCTRVCNISSLM